MPVNGLKFKVSMASIIYNFAIYDILFYVAMDEWMFCYFNLLFPENSV